MRLSSVLIAFLAISACNRPADDLKAEAALCPDLLRFDPEKAGADGKSVASGEQYLLGYYGYTMEIPGRVRTDLPVRMIESTSDSECPELNQRTREYARRFNQAVQANAKR